MFWSLLLARNDLSFCAIQRSCQNQICMVLILLLDLKQELTSFLVQKQFEFWASLSISL